MNSMNSPISFLEFNSPLDPLTYSQFTQRSCRKLKNIEVFHIYNFPKKNVSTRVLNVQINQYFTKTCSKNDKTDFGRYLIQNSILIFTYIYGPV